MSTGQLNSWFEDTWHWSIAPKAMPGYSALEPFSPAEVKNAYQATMRACADGNSKPNPGLFLVKLKSARDGPRKTAQEPVSQQAADDLMEGYNASRRAG